GNQKLLVNRLQQEEVKSARANELGERAAIRQKERLDQRQQGKIAADEKQILGALPGGDGGSLGEHGLVEGQDDAEPEQLDEHLDQEIAAESQLAGKAKAAEGEVETQITGQAGHRSSPSKGAVTVQACAIEPARPDDTRQRPQKLSDQSVDQFLTVNLADENGG